METYVIEHWPIWECPIFLVSESFWQSFTGHLGLKREYCASKLSECKEGYDKNGYSSSPRLIRHAPFDG